MLAFIGNVIIRAVAWLGFGRRPLRAIKPRISSIPLATASLGSHEPERPLRPVGRAPEPAPAGPLWSGSGEYSTAVSENPTLSLLRRRAFIQLFDHFGLVMIPSEAWTALDEVKDPVAAFRQFATWVGCVPEHVRRKDVAQLARMQIAIDLLVSLHQIRLHLSGIGVNRIRRALAFDDNAMLADQARLIESLSIIQVCRLRADGLPPCATYELFANLMDAECRDPLAAAPGDIEEAGLISDRLLRAMHSYTDCRAKILGAAAEIEQIWSHIPASTHDVDVRDGILIRAEDFDKDLNDNSSLGVDGIENLAGECAILLEYLYGIHARYASDAGARPGDAYVDERGSALKFFGFPLASSPSEEDIKKIFREMWKKYNVDDPTHRVTELTKARK